MKNLLEIKPLEGLGSVKFGMSPGEVDEIMNERQVWENWMGGNRNDALLYQGFIFDFDKHNTYGPLEDSKLVVITVHKREDAWLFGKLLDDWTEKDFLSFCARQNIAINENWKHSINIPQLGFDIYFLEEDSSAVVEYWMLKTH